MAPDDKHIYINEGAPDVQFSVKDQTRTEYSPDRKNNPPKTKLEAWLMMYGSNAMKLFFVNTNTQQLEGHGYEETSGYSEAIKFQGIIRLSIWFEFSDDQDKLWSTKSKENFIDPPNFGIQHLMLTLRK